MNAKKAIEKIYEKYRREAEKDLFEREITLKSDETPFDLESIL